MYAAILEQPDDGHEPVVCCRDAVGDPVRRPISDEYARTPVGDAEEPCPACGAIAYEECVPTESWRGRRSGPDGRMVPSPLVVCRVCGHQEIEGAIIRLSSPDGENETARAERIARARAEQRVQRWHGNKVTLRAVTFPIYAAEGWPAQINGSSSTDGELTGLTIAHTDSEAPELLDQRPRLQITTSRAEPHSDELDNARHTLEGWIHDELTGGRRRSRAGSDAAITLAFRALDRRRHAVALAATRSQALIMIDGEAASFLTLTTTSGRWVAVRRHDDLTITITARDLDPASLTIEPVADPITRLLGPEPEEPEVA